MKPEPLQHAAREWTANDLVEDLVSWRDRLEEWMKGVSDPRELALAIVELEDLLTHELSCLAQAKKRVIDLNG